MGQTYDVVESDGKTKTTKKYTCESESLSYTIIGDNIKEDFSFLTNQIPEKLGLVLKEIETAANISDAFYFESGNNVHDISEAYNEIKRDVELINSGLSTLYNAFVTDINNVNAELENNFGYWAFTKPKLAGKTVETVDSGESQSK